MKMAPEVKTIVWLYIAITLTIVEVTSRPGYEWQQTGCDFSNVKKLEICQICAKQTKSPIVYPMCCNEEDDVLNWCNKFIHFGDRLEPLIKSA